MSFPRNILVSLLVTPLVVFFSRSVSAFSITPSQPGATDFYYPETEYTVNGKKWVTKVDPSFGTALPSGGTAGSQNLLTPFKNNGWTFATGDLNGSFNISGFEALGSSNRVGANFYLDYVSGESDPVNDAQTKLYWIQRVTSNNDRDQGYGHPEDVIDVPFRSLPLRGCLESINSYASRLTMSRTMAA